MGLFSKHRKDKVTEKGNEIIIQWELMGILIGKMLADYIDAHPEIKEDSEIIKLLRALKK